MKLEFDEWNLKENTKESITGFLINNIPKIESLHLIDVKQPWLVPMNYNIGVLFLLDENKDLLYIEASQNIRRRLPTHLSKSEKKGSTSPIPPNKVRYFAILVSDDYTTSEFLERFYLLNYKTKFNKRSGRREYEKRT